MAENDIPRVPGTPSAMDRVLDQRMRFNKISLARVLEVNQDWKTPVVRLMLLEGGIRTAEFPNAGIDQVTGKTHGLFMLPRPDQWVVVGFKYSSYRDAVVLATLPYTVDYNFPEGKQGKEAYYTENRLVDQEDIELGHRTGSVLRFRQDGAVEVENWKTDASEVQSSVKMNADGTIVVSHKEGASINIDVDGNVQVVPASGKLVNVGAASPSKGGARLDDEVKSTAVEDATFWTAWQGWWTTWQVGYLAALATLQAGGGTPGAVVAFATTMQTLVGGMPSPPTSLTGKITVASTVVKVE